jgi:hypothetical protein
MQFESLVQPGDSPAPLARTKGVRVRFSRSTALWQHFIPTSSEMGS